jgi:hypothetical protein
MRSRQNGPAVFILLALVALVFFGFCLWALSQAMNTRVEDAQTHGLPSATTGDAPFVQMWSVSLNPPLVHEMALSPGQPGQFVALNRNEILRFDDRGARLATFAAPPKSTRIATDPTGALPYLMVVSSKTKWTGAIDYVVTTDDFLHALDGGGREIWKKRFDPKDVSVLEPVIARFSGTPVVVLSASKRIICFDVNGAELWNVPFWHHPQTVTEDGSGGLLAAKAPTEEIVRISADGKVLGAWGKGDGPRRFRAIKTENGVYGVSLRQVFGTAPGVRQALAFFDAGGAIIREIELPPDAGLLTYAPIAAMDVDGSGRRNWVVALADGTILVFSPTGEQIARHTTGMRLRTVMTLPQNSGPDLLITSTYRGLTAWRPVAGRLNPPR